MAASALCRYYSPVADSYRFLSIHIVIPKRMEQNREFLLLFPAQGSRIVYQDLSGGIYGDCCRVLGNDKETPCTSNKQAQAATGLTCNWKVRGSNLGRNTDCGGHFWIFLGPPMSAPRQSLKLGHDLSAPHHLQSITVTQSHSHFLTASLGKQASKHITSIQPYVLTMLYQ
jgi:hypothetical protein